jgi:hypothetical protein
MQLIVIANLTSYRSTGCSTQAKNNVTSRVRLDEKYAERRALAMLANQKPQFARVFGVFLQRDARLESSSPARTLEATTSIPARTLEAVTNVPAMLHPKI